MAILQYILTLFIGQKPFGKLRTKPPAHPPIKTTEPIRQAQGEYRSILLSANGRFYGVVEVLS